MDDSSQDPANLGTNADGTPKRRRRRRRKPVSSSSASDPKMKRAQSLASSGMDLANQDAEEALEAPRASVQSMESDASPLVSVSMAPDEPAPEKEMVYEAPIYQPPGAPAPISEPTPESAPEFTPEPTPEPSAPEPPVSTSEASPFDLASSFGTPPPSNEPVSPPYDPWASMTADASPASPEPAPPEPSPPPPPAPEPASTSEASPFDLASSFGGGASDSGESSYSAPPSYDPEPLMPEPEPERVEDNAPPSYAPPPEPEPYSAPEPPLEPAPAESTYESQEPTTPETFEGEVVEESTSPDASEAFKNMAMDGGLRDRLENLLAEANLTTRHVKFCCGGLVIVALIIVMGFFLVPRLLNDGLPSSGDSEQPEEDTPDEIDGEPVETPEEDSELPEEDDEEPQEDDEEPQEDDGEAAGPVWVDPSIYSGILIGSPKFDLEAETGLDAGILVGSGEDEETDLPLSEFQGYMSDLEDLYNLYFVDVQALLDGSNDRAQTLDDHIQFMKDTYNNGVDNYEAIGAVKAQLSEEFDANEIEKEAIEERFFAEFDAFDGEEAEETLVRFIELKQVEVDLKAKFLAFGNLEASYETVLQSMSPLIQDLELNREALISGVQIVDVLNSDLDLILGEEDLEE